MIESYLSGEIDRKQLEDFAIQNGILDLDAEIEWMKNVRLAIEAEGLAHQLKEVLPKTSTKGTIIKMHEPSKKGRYSALAIAASVVLLLGLLFILKPNNTQKLYSKYEFVDPGLPVLMSQTHQYEIYDALSYYSEQNYEVTIAKLSEINLKNSGVYNDTIQYYLGAAQLYNGNVSESMLAFSVVTENDASIFNERAEWLYLLAHLKNGDITKTKLLLEPIVQNAQHSFYEQAIALLSEVK
jgi:hypothetical protein